MHRLTPSIFGATLLERSHPHWLTSWALRSGVTKENHIRLRLHGLIYPSNRLPDLRHRCRVGVWTWHTACEQVRAERAAQVPLLVKEAGNAFDVANAAVFLASDEARYITGVLLPVDGGVLLKNG